MDVFARSSGEITEIYTVENCTAVIVVLAAALGVISALISVAVMLWIGVGINAAIVGAIAGGVGGAASALLANLDRIR